VRTRLLRINLLAVVLLTTANPLYAMAGQHKTCVAAKQPDCHKIAQLTECCCCDGDGANQPGVTQVRADVTPDQSVVWILPSTVEAPQAGVASWHVATSPPHGPSPDLPILLADLRL